MAGRVLNVARTTATFPVVSGGGGGGTITDGRDVTAALVGYQALGATLGDLSTVAGATYSTNNQTISRKLFTAPVIVTGDGVTFQECFWSFAGGASTDALTINNGASCHVRYSTFTPNAGTSFSHGVLLNDGADMLVEYCDVSHCANLMTGFDAGTVIQYNYLHDVSDASNPGDHRDGMEVYGGNNGIIRWNRIIHGDGQQVSPINNAPWFGASTTIGWDIYGNWIDGGQFLFTIDAQSTAGVSGIQSIRVYGNFFGGHQAGSSVQYSAMNDVDSRGFARTIADQVAFPAKIYWPITSETVGGTTYQPNLWYGNSDLVPNLDGQVVAG